MARDKPTKLNSQISEEAAEWVVEFRTGDIDAAGRREFDTWVRSSPEHLRAFLEIAAIWNEGSALDELHKLEIGTLTQRIRAEGNVVPLGLSLMQKQLYEEPAEAIARPLSPPATGGRALSRRLVVAASIAFLTLAASSLLWLEFLRAPTYATAIGEQRTLTLSDGSTVELNSRSRIR